MEVQIMKIEPGPRIGWRRDSASITENTPQAGQIPETPTNNEAAAGPGQGSGDAGRETAGSPASPGYRAIEAQLFTSAIKSSLTHKQTAAPAVPAHAFGPDAPAGNGTPQSATFDAAAGVQHTDGRLSAKARYDQLPSDLRSKMKQKVWDALPEGQRSTLIASYQQFKQAGVWDEITEVIGQKEKREAPVRLPGGYETDVAGNSGAIQYRVRDPKEFVRKVQEKNPRFGVDGGVMGAMHPGQTGMREAGPPTSLHISVGPGNLMDAHIDRVNPVNQPKNGQTQMNVRRGAEHWQREVLPEMIRKHIGPAGVIVGGSVKGGSRGEPGAGGPQWEPNGRRSGEGRVMVNLEFNGVRKTKEKIRKEPMEGSPDVPGQVMKNVAKRLDDGSIAIRFPRPAGIEPGAEPDPKAVAGALAAKIREAIENGDSRITIDLNVYSGQKGLQKAVAGEMRRLADAVLQEMKAAGIDVSAVTALTVTFGRKTEGETVSITR
jgi:hypothetical protein